METYSSFTKTIICVFLFLGLLVTSVHGQGTRVGFYKKLCPRAEAIVRATVLKHLKSNPRNAPGLVRLHFHDCFVRGCDASVLLEGNSTEKTAVPNRGINGYDVITEAKKRIEAECTQVVSCADILALAARDSVVLTGGRGWDVPTGRRDGRVSIASETSGLPGPREPVSSQLSKLQNLDLNKQDLVALVGSHTIGTTSCALISSRLFNFPNSSTGADPTIDPSFLPTLRALCPQGGNATTRVELDNRSGARFDKSYFNNIRRRRGVLPSDQFLWTDPETQPIVLKFLTGELNFDKEFGKSMIKMSNVSVLTGPGNGEIRKVCTAVNKL